jgi:hypothetical protein
VTRPLAVAAAAALAVAALAGCLRLGAGGERSIEDARPTIVADDRLMLAAAPGRAEAAARSMRRLGADWLRVTADWSRVAPRPAAARRPDFDPGDPAAYPPGAWTALDRAVRAAGRHGLAAAIDVAGRPPRWALAPGGGPDPAQFGRFAAAVARRYSGRYRGLPGAVAFTLWDRPNSAASLSPQWRRTSRGWTPVSAHRYRAMVYAGHAAIQRAAPDAVVLIGSTASTGAPAPRRPADGSPPLRFLRDLACVTAAGRPIRRGPCASFRALPGDGWAHGPRPGPRAPWLPSPRPDDVGVADLRRLTRLLESLRASGRLAATMPVYVTAFGYPSGPPDGSRGPGLYLQARWLGEAERLARRTPGVRSFAQAPLRDPRAADRGLELPGAVPKPARAAFAYPLVVHRAGAHRVRIWGRVRPVADRGRFRISVRAGGGPWRALAQFSRGRRTEADGSFAVDASTGFGGIDLDPRWSYRLELLRDGRWRPAGLPVLGAR